MQSSVRYVNLALPVLLILGATEDSAPPGLGVKVPAYLNYGNVVRGLCAAERGHERVERSTWGMFEVMRRLAKLCSLVT